MKKLLFALSLIGLSASPAIAAGDAEAGKALSATCAACHMADGNSMVPMWPKLAGQHPQYLIKQINDFKAGAMSAGKQGRFDPTMSPMALALPTDQAVADVAAYFASQAVSANPKQQAAAVAADLWNGGDAERGIAACAACHGPTATGMAAAGFPSLKGQHATYIEGQLKKFRDGSRNNDQNGMMQDTAKKLTDNEISELAKYISSL
ncbi:cytochrome c [Paraferrimonas sp. SM1919]|uniref:c-type cytochrome n=1 Tax=Paraferrimonas sp. SM1919 TaxID=2662263 RepID=UPI0013D55F46|nr:c-type cytochrome [Paraferrimonas sp. SM1919]